MDLEGTQEMWDKIESLESQLKASEETVKELEQDRVDSYHAAENRISTLSDDLQASQEQVNKACDIIIQEYLTRGSIIRDRQHVIDDMLTTPAPTEPETPIKPDINLQVYGDHLQDCEADEDLDIDNCRCGYSHALLNKEFPSSIAETPKEVK